MMQSQLYCLLLVPFLIQSSQCQGNAISPRNTISETAVVYTVDNAIVTILKRFCFQREIKDAAIIMKIDNEKQQVVIEENYEDTSPEEVKDELPETEPRFIVYKYNYVQEDGRQFATFCFMFYRPAVSKPEHEMMYSISINELLRKTNFSKALVITNAKELTKEWLREKCVLYPCF